MDDFGNVTAIALGAAVISATAADGSGGSAECSVTVVPTPVEYISLSETEWSGRVGHSFTLTATVEPSDATDKTVIWSSSDESIATVDSDGNVTAVSVGDAVITATAADGSGISASCLVTVVPTPVESITLSETRWIGFEGDTFTLFASVAPYDATDASVIWSSDRPGVAEVDAYGNVRAIAQGTAVITATAADGSGVSADCHVVVMSREIPDLPVLVESIKLSEEEWEAKVGETLQLEAEVIPAYATNKRIYWSSSDESVVTVDHKGVMTAVGAGHAVVKAQVFDGSGATAECRVTVAEADPDAVTSVADDDAIFDVYTQQGILLRRSCSSADLKQLNPGIYIIRNGGSAKTIYLRN